MARRKSRKTIRPKNIGVTVAFFAVLSPLIASPSLLAYDLNTWQWARAALAAVLIGMSKTGFNGISLLSIALMADLLPARQSTGVILPMLLFADCFAVRSFRQHALWSEIRRVLPSALLGVAAGALIMQLFSDPARLSDSWFKRIIGGIVFALTLLQYGRRQRPGWFTGLPAESKAFAWLMGGFAGVTTMLANAAGPVISLYLLAARLPKMEFVGTSAWIFLLLNVSKLPFSYRLGLIRRGFAGSQPVPRSCGGSRGVARALAAENRAAKLVRATAAVFRGGRVDQAAGGLKITNNCCANGGMRAQLSSSKSRGGAAW